MVDVKFNYGLINLFAFVDSLYQRVPNLIGGTFVNSQAAASIDVINPVSAYLFYFTAEFKIVVVLPRNFSVQKFGYRQHKKWFHKYL